MNPKICILYGLNEGPSMGDRFESACKRAGMEITRDPMSADLIFAHSGGCLLLPPKNHAQTILMVGVPYRPGQLWIVSTVVKVWREGRLYHREHRMRQWAIKWMWHLRYAANVKDGWRMAKNRDIHKPWNNSQPQIILRNRHDAYCTPAVYELPFRGPRTFVSLPGEHDDCWENPDPYLMLLQLQGS
jgi:hypothetical protein